MAVSQLVYKTIKKAVIIRVKRGEDVYEILESYPKLSEAQKAQMVEELIEEGIIVPEPEPEPEPAPEPEPKPEPSPEPEPENDEENSEQPENSKNEEEEGE